MSADEELMRAHAGELTALAARHGITALRYASPGRLVGHVARDRDVIDMIEFDLAAQRLLGADVSLFPDAALTERSMSADLVTARPL